MCYYTIYYMEQAFLAPDIIMNNKAYKRQYRQLDDETKQKISASTQGKPKSVIHREHIRQGMLQYWETVPNRDDTQWNNNTNVNDDEN